MSKPTLEERHEFYCYALCELLGMTWSCGINVLIRAYNIRKATEYEFKDFEELYDTFHAKYAKMEQITSVNESRIKTLETCIELCETKLNNS